MWTTWSGCDSTVPSAISITTPSVIIALLSATMGLALSGENSCACSAASPPSSASRSERTLTPSPEPPMSESFGANAVDQHQPARAFDGAAFSAVVRALQRRGIGRRCQRQHLAHQRRAGSVYFQSSIRRCGRPVRS
jgi:hypothetical protein